MQLKTLTLKGNMLIFLHVLLALIMFSFITLFKTKQINVREPLIQEVVPEEQTLPPQKPFMPLSRFIRERRSAVLVTTLHFSKKMR